MRKFRHKIGNAKNWLVIRFTWQMNFNIRKSGEPPIDRVGNAIEVEIE